MDFKRLNETLRTVLAEFEEPPRVQLEEVKKILGTPLTFGNDGNGQEQFYVYYNFVDHNYIIKNDLGCYETVNSISELINENGINTLRENTQWSNYRNQEPLGISYEPFPSNYWEDKKLPYLSKNAGWGNGSTQIGNIYVYYPQDYLDSSKSNSDKGQIKSHEKEECVGTIEVTYIGIERGDNDYDTLWFHRDLDTNEYFYRSDLNDGDGFKTLKDAINTAKEECKNFDKEFYRNVRFGKFEKD